jgi:hypothetical protein
MIPAIPAFDGEAERLAGSAAAAKGLLERLWFCSALEPTRSGFPRRGGDQGRRGAGQRLCTMAGNRLRKTVFDPLHWGDGPIENPRFFASPVRQNPLS